MLEWMLGVLLREKEWDGEAGKLVAIVSKNIIEHRVRLFAHIVKSDEKLFKREKFQRLGRDQ